GTGCALWLALILISVFMKSQNKKAAESAGASAGTLVYGAERESVSDDKESRNVDETQTDVNETEE
ncbi:MAG: hypothetical protein OSJ83_14340, partial [Clostridia bacterium]|nr:hypothetical protein [Clostridia bacterium]